VKIFVATFPFGKSSKEPIELLEKTKWKIVYNSFGRRLKDNETEKIISEFDGIIAGTEPYTKKAIENAKNLKVISRVGVGLDNVDFQACLDNNIVLTYTPEAPADAVADLTIAQIINLLRGTFQSDREIRSGMWNRVMGRLISECKIGILGMGRIGKRVAKRLCAFDAEIYGCDLKPDLEFGKKYHIIWKNKEELFKICDLITIHIPMSKKNLHCVGFKEMSSMKSGSFIVNTSRGPIIDENALYSLVLNKH